MPPILLFIKFCVARAGVFDLKIPNIEKASLLAHLRAVINSTVAHLIFIVMFLIESLVWPALLRSQPRD